MGLRKKKTLIDQASDMLDDAKPKIESAMSTAKDVALDVAKDAKDKAGPVLADAKAKAGPVLADAKAKAGPAIAEGAAIAADKASVGAAIAAEKAAVARDLAAEKAAVGRDLAAAKVAQIKGEKPKKGGKLKKLLLITGLAALGGVIFKKLRGDQASENWQSSYVPTPAPSASAPKPAAATGDDTGGSSPDEALADAAEEPHAASTPDDPAETVTIDEDAAKKN